MLEAAAFDRMPTRARRRGVELALHSVEDRSLFEADNGLFWMAATLALANADHPEVPALWAETQAYAHRNGSLFSQLSMSLWDGAFKLAQGELAEAGIAPGEPGGGGARTASRSSRPRPTRTASSAARCSRRATWRAPGRRSTAADPDGDQSDGANFVRRTIVGLHLASGDGEGALAAAEDFERHAGPARNPAWVPWRSLKAQALAMLGRRDEAIELAGRRWSSHASGAPPPAWATRCGCSASCSGKDGMAELEQAAELLEVSSQRIERARALAALGAELRRARRPTDAREPLRRALELASIGREGARGARALGAVRDRRAAADDGSRGRGGPHRA